MKKILIAAIMILLPIISHGAIIFQDDFEAQSGTWNLGDGALSTPGGQSGSWSYWERTTASAFGCSDTAGMPAASGGYFLYMDATGGYSGGKALRFIHSPSCDLSTNAYPASTDWVSPGGYKELYFGYHFKMDATFGSTTNKQCKWGHWIDQGTSSGSAGNGVSNQAWFQMFGMNYGASDHWDISIQSGSGPGVDDGWWNTGISGTDIKDGNWHWIEYRWKVNSSAGASDAVITTWVDGVQQGTVTNFQTLSGAAPYIYDIKWEMGNCEHNDGSWYMTHTGWKGWWIDNVKISTTYIGPPEGGSVSTPTMFGVSLSGGTVK